MGFLTVNGVLMTYSEYKHMLELIKMHGVMQFVNLYNIHKDRQINAADLHWGEEIEYALYAFDDKNRQVKLTCDANDVIEEFNAGSNQHQSFDSESTDPTEE